MTPDVTIRPKAFADGTEVPTIGQMGDDGDLTLSLVAQTDQVVGHVAFSPAHITDAAGDWYRVEPISVVKQYQDQDIAPALEEHAT